MLALKIVLSFCVCNALVLNGEFIANMEDAVELLVNNALGSGEFQVIDLSIQF